MELLPEEIKAKLPPLYSTEKEGLNVLARLRFFTPDSNWSWYVTEFDGEDTFFGLVDGFVKELGYFSFAELQSAKGPMGLPIERDLHFRPRTLNQIKQNKEPPSDLEQVLARMDTLEPIVVDGSRYIRHDGVVERVVDVLFPLEPPKTESDLNSIMEMVQRVCLESDYDGEAIELKPPLVLFDQRGTYHKAIPPIQEEQISAFFDTASVSRLSPKRELQAQNIWYQLSWSRHGRAWHSLSRVQQQIIKKRVHELATKQGWQSKGERFVHDLPANLSSAKTKIATLLESQNGHDVSRWDAVQSVQRGAYGRTFEENRLTPELEQLLVKQLESYNYETTADKHNLYRQRPLQFTDSQTTELTQTLTSLPHHQTKSGEVILVEEIRQALLGVLNVDEIRPIQFEQLLAEDQIIGRWLRKQGFSRESTSCSGSDFLPPQPQRQLVFGREVRVDRETAVPLELADGLLVYAPIIALDGQSQTIVCLEMVGPKQSVKANWAALVNGNRKHALEGQQIKLQGMSDHLLLQTNLPCGWANWMLLHQQASLQEAQPNQWFYLLDEGQASIPNLFYPLLNKSLALPLLKEWIEVLWEDGRDRDLIKLLSQDTGIGAAVWCVHPTTKTWTEIIKTRLADGIITF